MFEDFKAKLRERLDEDCIKAEIEGEPVYLSKGSIISWIPIIGKRMKDWKRIYPIIDEDNNINFVNLIFGGWRNFTYLIILLGLVAMTFLGLYEIFSSMQSILDDPCVQRCLNKTINPINSLPNLSLPN